MSISVSPTTGSEGFSLTSGKELKTDNGDFGGWLGEYSLINPLCLLALASHGIQRSITDGFHFYLVCPGDGDVQGLFYENSSVGDDVPQGCETVQLDAVYKTSS